MAAFDRLDSFPDAVKGVINLKTYTIILHDNSRLENLTMNGDMFVSNTEITSDILNDNTLKTVTIIESENRQTTTTTINNAICDGIIHWPDGWLFNIRERSSEEKIQAEMATHLEEIDAALVELAELIAEV